MIVLAKALKVFVEILGVLVGFTAVVLALPISIKGSGHFSAEDNVEGILNFLAHDEPDEIGLLLTDYTYGFRVDVLLGLVTLQGNDTIGFETRVFGIRVPRALKTLRTGTESRETGRPGFCGEPFDQEQKGEKLGNKRRGKVQFGEIKKFLSRPVRRKTFRTLRALQESAHLDIGATVKLGLGDPGLTGMVFGLGSAVLGALGVKGVALSPEFQDRVLSADGKASMFMVPLRFLWITGVFALSPEIKKLWWKGVNVGKKRSQGS